MVDSATDGPAPGLDPLGYAWLIPDVIEEYKLRSPYLDPEDLVGYGWVGLLKAVARYDPCRGGGFGNYAKYWIYNEIMLAIYDYSSPIRIPVYLKKAGVRWLGREGFERIRDHVASPGEAELWSWWDVAGWIDSALSGLSGDDREVVEMYYGLGGRGGGMSLRLIAESRDRSKDWARDRLNRGLSALRRRVARWEETGRWPG